MSVRTVDTIEELIAACQSGTTCSLGPSFPRNCTYLSMSEKYIGAYGAQVLAGVLGQLTSLQTLDLSGNKIGFDGTRALAGVLGQLTSLKMLDLGFNSIGNDGVRTLTGVLGHLTSLQTLDLSLNGIGSEGMEALSCFMGNNKIVCQVYLFDNDFDIY